MDVLSSIFSMMRLSSTVYFRSDFSSPWGMKASQSNFAQFHMVLAGESIISFSDRNSIRLSSGDIVLLPQGTAHVISDASKTKIEDGRKVVSSIQSGRPLFTGEKTTATLICGHFEFDKSLAHPVIKTLPEIIYIKDIEHRERTWFESVYNLIVSESALNLPGTNIVMVRLAEVMLIHILRTYIQREQSSNPFYQALTDVNLSQPLTKIHLQPSYPWSLKKLAKEAGMSRTLFANRFKSMVGTTPMEYVTQWRILKAKELLAKTCEPIANVAEQVGYSSEASFNRAFKRHTKATPWVFRKSA